MRLFLAIACGCLLAVSIVRADEAARRVSVQSALTQAEAGRLDAATRLRLADDPLLPWIEYADLHHDLGTADPAEVRDFLTHYSGQAVATLLREQWLGELDRRRDWKNFRTFYTGGGSSTLRCADLAARMDAGEPDSKDRASAWYADATALWQTGDALSVDCDAASAQLDARGKLTAELRWQRMDAAASDGDTSVMRSATRGLPPDQAALANAYAAFIAAPDASAATWPVSDRSRRIAVLGLTRMARRDPDAAAALLSKLTSALKLDEADRGHVLYAVALWAAGSYLPNAAARLAAVPASAYDAALREWQFRVAVANGDDASALKAIVAMAPAQRNDPHWQYFEARLRERAGDAKAAAALYAQAARSATYHGFLAADRLRQPYSICPLELRADASERARVAATPALVRALELFDVDRIAWAQLEWKQALAGFDDPQRQIAVAFAQDAGWYDRAAFALGKNAAGESAPDELRLYALRFPLPHAGAVREQARREALDPAWIAAEIRAESVWMPQARSSADARGLMQLLPSTGAQLARALGIAWNGADTLYQPLASITLGSAYLRQLLDRLDDRAYLAIGTYNAGVAPVRRWLAQRPGLDADFWIETVNYKETRDYIARVLAFSVIYDWRMTGTAIPLSERMFGRTVSTAQRRGFVCPTTPVAASEAAR